MPRRLIVSLLPHRLLLLQTVFLLLASFAIFTSQASAVSRFADRSLFVTDPTPSATTKYTFTFTYTTQTTVGSVDLLFCTDPVPTASCDPPPGLDTSNATLSAQTGETGYALTQRSANHLVLSRTPGMVGNTPSSYTFDNIVNPTDTTQPFAVRLGDYASADASGMAIDLGAVLSEVNLGISIDSQVPPILIFCMAQQVSPDCSSTSGGNYSDMGTLGSGKTLTAQSQMAAGTNALGGYAVTVNGTTMAAGTNVITALAAPTVSAPGNSQFGINLRANSSPAVGSDPDGSSSGSVISPGYDTPNEFMYHDGDTVASASNVSPLRRFTVSYIVNAPPDIRAGVYTTTITYICSGRF